MGVKAIIFDFDQTIADTSSIEYLRKMRRWGDVYNNLHKISLYPGMDHVFKHFKEMNIKIAVVTNSPSVYCKKALEYLGLDVDVLIGHHDTKLKKPNPDPILLALQKMNIGSEDVYGIGDNLNDILAYKSAGIIPVAAKWSYGQGAPDWAVKLRSPLELLNILNIKKMEFRKENILTLLQLKGLGRVSAFNISNYANTNNLEINDSSDLYELIKICKEKKVVTRLGDFTINDIQFAIDNAESIIEKSAREGIFFTSYYDQNFPKLLKNVISSGKDVSPILLFYKGNLEDINRLNSIAIIGTREVTPEGISAGSYVSKEFAKNGFNIVSGLAKGCDTVAHRAALSVEGGKTTAILAHGLDSVYPKENQFLADEILEKKGLLLSEYSIGVSVRGPQLVERDRLQSGMSIATIVIQTGVKGGSMHAVNNSFENGKPVYAIKYKDEKILEHDKVLGNELLIENNIASPLNSFELNSIINQLK